MAQQPAPWKAPLQAAIDGNKDNQASRFMMLATVKPDGRPSNRTLVFRGFMGPTDRITFFGDARTRKVGEIAGNPWGELAWWLGSTADQFRLLGRLYAVTKDESDPELQKARVEAWRGMENSDPGRQHPTWPHPRTPRVADAAVFEERETTPEAVSDNFMLVYLEVEEVDHYALSANVRTLYTKQPDGSWVVESINP